jgi:hypothetical protein
VRKSGKIEKKCEYSFLLRIIIETLAVLKRRPNYEHQNKQANITTFAAGMRRSGTGKD